MRTVAGDFKFNPGPIESQADLSPCLIYQAREKIETVVGLAWKVPFPLPMRMYEYIKNEDGTFTCPHCNEVKKNQSTMHMHYRARHDGAYKHKCKSCQYETSTKQSLDKHILAKHPDQAKEKPKPCACPSCEFTCLSKGGLRSHYLLRHMAEQVKTYFGKTDQDEISCTHCGTEFASKPAFIYHLAGCLPSSVITSDTIRKGLCL